METTWWWVQWRCSTLRQLQDIQLYFSSPTIESIYEWILSFINYKLKRAARHAKRSNIIADTILSMIFQPVKMTNANVIVAREIFGVSSQFTFLCISPSTVKNKCIDFHFDQTNCMRCISNWINNGKMTVINIRLAATTICHDFIFIFKWTEKWWSMPLYSESIASNPNSTSFGCLSHVIHSYDNQKKKTHAHMKIHENGANVKESFWRTPNEKYHIYTNISL